MKTTTPSDAPAAVNGDSHDVVQPRGSLSIWQVLSSTLAAFLGVQSKENKVRDFESGKASHFFVAGAIFTVLFVVGMIFLVRGVIAIAS